MRKGHFLDRFEHDRNLEINTKILLNTLYKVRRLLGLLYLPKNKARKFIIPIERSAFSSLNDHVNILSNILMYFSVSSICPCRIQTNDQYFLEGTLNSEYNERVLKKVIRFCSFYYYFFGIGSRVGR